MTMGVVSSQTHASTHYYYSLFYTVQASFYHFFATTFPQNIVPTLGVGEWKLALKNINRITCKSLIQPTSKRKIHLSAKMVISAELPLKHFSCLKGGK